MFSSFVSFIGQIRLPVKTFSLICNIAGKLPIMTGDELNIRWEVLVRRLEDQFGMEMTMESVLFLIGMRELGAGPEKFTKEQKVDLMHIAICRILSFSGYYRLSHLDQEGWPHWEVLRPLPHTDMFTQVNLLKAHIVEYFDEVYDG
jgi:hypothetical protein